MTQKLSTQQITQLAPPTRELETRSGGVTWGHPGLALGFFALLLAAGLQWGLPLPWIGAAAFLAAAFTALFADPEDSRTL